MNHNQPVEFVYPQIEAHKAMKKAMDYSREQRYQEAYEAALELATHARLMAVAYRSWTKEHP